MQQGGSSYGVTREVSSTQYVGGGDPAASGGRGRMMDGVSGGGHDKSAGGGGGGNHTHSDQKPTEAGLADAASPISSRSMGRSTNFDELLQRPAGSGGLPDVDDALAEEEEKRGTSGNRWPRQETLALLRIRSEMDAIFRDATLKAPLWDEVSWKLAELGYHRSAKKCKEKFENVHKYYKRTKEGRTGRQDGKSYRFFTELEALHGGPTTASTSGAGAQPPITTPSPAPQGIPNAVQSAPIVGSATAGVGVAATRIPPTQPNCTNLMSSIPPSTQSGDVPWAQISTRISPLDLSTGISSSGGSSTSSGDSSDEIQEQSRHHKRKRTPAMESSTQKMMNFFEDLMKQVVEKQMALQQRFLETIEKREDDRMIREEAWKRQEMARVSRELDILAQERAMSASRDTAVIAFLQKITGQTIHIPPATIPPPAVNQPPPPMVQPIPPLPQQPIVAIQSQPQPPLPPPHQQKHHHHRPSPEAIDRSLPTPSMDILSQDKEPITSTVFDPSSSRWPKPEVLALIKLRNGREASYQEAGPKGPLWEEISSEMSKLGYKRSSKRCKEKWENINKYYKKVKESNKKRPEDSKTCPYFHELDALYQKKGHSSRPNLEITVDEGISMGGEMVAIMPTPISAAPPEPEPARPDEGGGGDRENGRGVNGGGSGAQIQKDNVSDF